MFDKQIYLDVITLQHMLGGGRESTILTNCSALGCDSQSKTVL